MGNKRHINPFYNFLCHIFVEKCLLYLSHYPHPPMYLFVFIPEHIRKDNFKTCFHNFRLLLVSLFAVQSYQFSMFSSFHPLSFHTSRSPPNTILRTLLPTAPGMVEPLAHLLKLTNPHTNQARRHKSGLTKLMFKMFASTGISTYTYIHPYVPEIWLKI